MFHQVQFRKSFLFLVGFLSGSAVASVAAFGLAWVIDAIADTEAIVPSLHALNELGDSSDSDNELQGRSEKLFDNIGATPHPNSRFVRKATLYSTLLQANAEQLEELFDESQSLPNGPWRQEIQSAILERLTMLNSAKAFDFLSKLPTVQRTALLGPVFREWSLRDLHKAVDVGRRLDFPEKEIALKVIFHANTDLSEEHRIAIGKRFGDERLARRLIETSKAMALIDTPHHAWDVLIGDGLDVRFRLRWIEDIAQTWVSRDGIGVLSEIRAHLASVIDFAATDHLLVHSIARANPKEVFKKAAMNPDLQSLLSRIAFVWTETDPFGALEGASLLDDAQRKRQVNYSIMRRWNELNPRELLENRTIFPIEMQFDAITEAISAIARIAPREAVAFVEDLSTEEIDTSRVAVSLVDAWSTTDPDSALEWVLSGPNDQNPYFGRMVEIAISRLVLVDAERAMELALNPLDSKWPEALDSSVIWELSLADVDAAKDLLPKVSVASRSRCYRTVGSTYARQGKPERALELARQLVEEERDDYYWAIFNTWANHNPDQLLKAIEYLPSSKVQGMAAQNLIYRNNSRHFFSEEQVELVNQFLGEGGAEE